MALPGKGTGDWKFAVSGEGHDEVTHFSIRDDGQPTAAAALALFALPAARAWRRHEGR